MPFKADRDNWDCKCQGWYRPINPNEHIYTAGYGFSPRSPVFTEQKLIARCGAAAIVCLVAFMFLSSFLSQFFGQLLSRLLPAQLYPSLVDVVNELSLMLAAMGALTLPFVAYAAHTRIPWASAVPMRRVSASLIFSAIAMMLAVSVVGIYASNAVYTVFAAIDVYFYEPMLVMPTEVAGMFLYVVNIAVVPAIFEEIAFRGFLMQSLRRFGDSFALISSSILFALVHISPLSIPNALVVGLAIGYFVLFTGSVHTGMIMHMVHNLLALIVSQLGMLDHSIGNIVFISVQLLYLLVGIVAVIWLVRSYENIFSLKNSNTVNRSGEKLRCFFCTLPFFIFIIIILMQAGAYIL